VLSINKNFNLNLNFINKHKRHVLVTDIVKKHPTLDISTGVKNAKLELVPNIPVKTLNWFFRQKSFENEDVITGKQ